MGARLGVWRSGVFAKAFEVQICPTTFVHDCSLQDQICSLHILHMTSSFYYVVSCNDGGALNNTEQSNGCFRIFLIRSVHHKIIFSLILISRLYSFSRCWGPFLESAGNLSDPESHRNVSNLTSTELLFYSHILNMNTGSLHTRSFRSMQLSVCVCR